MKESFKQKMQENKPPLTFKNTKKNICLKKNVIFFLTLTPIVQHPNYQHYHPNHQILLRCQWYQIQGPRAGRDWNWKMMRPALTFLIVIIFVDSVTSIWQEHSEGFPEWSWVARQNLLYKIPQWLSGSGGIIQKPLMILFVLKTTTTKRLLPPNSFFFSQRFVPPSGLPDLHEGLRPAVWCPVPRGAQVCRWHLQLWEADRRDHSGTRLPSRPAQD